LGLYGMSSNQLKDSLLTPSLDWVEKTYELPCQTTGCCFDLREGIDLRQLLNGRMSPSKGRLTWHAVGGTAVHRILP
jgi:hypothetical protein